MSGKRYTEEFEIEAVKQVLERGHGVQPKSGGDCDTARYRSGENVFSTRALRNRWLPLAYGNVARDAFSSSLFVTSRPCESKE